MASTFKVPASYDQNRPRFDGETASSLKAFLRDCEAVCKNGKITDEDAMKGKLLDYVDSMDIREMWETLPSFKATMKFADWKEEILRLYPEVEDMDLGSLGRLAEVCKRNRLISRAELGKLRRFIIAFTTEAEKLRKGSAQVTNKQLVEWILDVLDDSFAKDVESAMNQHAIASIANPVATVAAGPSRRGDKLHYQKVFELADFISDNWSGRAAMNTLTGTDRYEPTPSKIPTIMTRGIDNSASKIKAEVNEKLDLFAGEIAEVKTLARSQEKRFDSLDSSVKRIESAFETSLRSMNQAIRGPAPHQLISAPGMAARNEEPQGRGDIPKSRTGDMSCHFCLGPHFIRECHNKEEFINIGWIIIENGLIKLGDGKWIPKFPENVSRMVKVEDYYRKQGISRESAKAKLASMMQTFHQGGMSVGVDLYSPDMDRIDHLYDFRDDEMRSANVQSMYNSQNSLLPSQPLGTYTPQGIQSQMLNRVQPAPVAPVQGTAGVDITQLIQLFNAARSGDSANGSNIQDQYVATRTGARTDPSNPAGF